MPMIFREAEMLDSEAWTRLMAEVVEADLETGEYKPGNVDAPGDGTEGGDPLGLKYVGMGPLAFVLNESLDSAVQRGADKDSMLADIAQEAGEGIEVADIQAVLDGDVKCPPAELLQAFGTSTSIDLSIIIDAAERGGCKNVYSAVPTDPPGF